MPDYDVVRELQDNASRGDIKARAVGGFAIRGAGAAGTMWMRRDLRSGWAESWAGISTRQGVQFQRIGTRSDCRAAALAGRPKARYVRASGSGFTVFGSPNVLPVMPYFDAVPSTSVDQLLRTETGAESFGAGRYRVHLNQRRGYPAAVLIEFSGGLLRRIVDPSSGEALRYTYGPQSIPHPRPGEIVNARRFGAAQVYLTMRRALRDEARAIAYAASLLSHPSAQSVWAVARRLHRSSLTARARLRRTTNGVELTFRNRYGAITWVVRSDNHDGEVVARRASGRRGLG